MEEDKEPTQDRKKVSYNTNSGETENTEEIQQAEDVELSPPEMPLPSILKSKEHPKEEAKSAESSMYDIQSTPLDSNQTIESQLSSKDNVEDPLVNLLESDEFDSSKTENIDVQEDKKIASFIAQSEMDEDQLPPPSPPEEIPMVETGITLDDNQLKPETQQNKDEPKKQLELSSEYVVMQPTKPNTVDQITQHDSPQNVPQSQMKCSAVGPVDLKYTILDVLSGQEALPCNDCDQMEHGQSSGDDDSLTLMTNLILGLIENVFKRLMQIAADKLTFNNASDDIVNRESRIASEQAESSTTNKKEESVPPTRDVDTFESSQNKEINSIDIPPATELGEE